MNPSNLHRRAKLATSSNMDSFDRHACWNAAHARVNWQCLCACLNWISFKILTWTNYAMINSTIMIDGTSANVTTDGWVYHSLRWVRLESTVNKLQKTEFCILTRVVLLARGKVSWCRLLHSCYQVKHRVSKTFFPEFSPFFSPSNPVVWFNRSKTTMVPLFTL